MGNQKLTILLVEDDPDVLETTRLMLIDGGFEVVTALNGTDALITLGRSRHIGLVISDIHTEGGIDGIQLVIRLRKLGLSIPAVLTSGEPPNLYGDYPHSVVFVAKPFSSDSLLGAVRACVNK